MTKDFEELIEFMEYLVNKPLDSTWAASDWGYAADMRYILTEVVDRLEKAKYI